MANIRRRCMLRDGIKKETQAQREVWWDLGRGVRWGGAGTQRYRRGPVRV